MNYNKAIKIARILSGKTMVDMSSAIGIDKSLLSRIEQGKREVSMQIFTRIANQLDVPLDLMLFLAMSLEEVKSIPEDKLDEIRKAIVDMLVFNY